MKVLFLASWYPMGEGSGNGIFAVRQAEALQQAYLRSGRQVSVDLMALQPLGWTGLDLRKRGELVMENQGQQGVRHWVSTYRDGQGSLLSFLRQVGGWIQLIKAYRAYHGSGPTVVIAQVTWKAAVVAFLWGRPFGVVEHWSGYLLPKPPLGWLVQHLTRFVLRKARSVSAVSPWLGQGMVSFCSGLKVELMPNVIAENYWNLSQVDAVLRNPTWFLHVSDLAEVKNPALLFEAWEQSGLAQQGYRLRLAGEYQESSRSRYASVEGVDWLGVLKPTELCYEMQACRALLLTSRHETFSLLAAEALLNGCSLWVSYPPLKAFYQGLEGLRPIPDNEVSTWSNALQIEANQSFKPWDTPDALAKVRQRMQPYRSHEAGLSMMTWIDQWKP